MSSRRLEARELQCRLTYRRVISAPKSAIAAGALGAPRIGLTRRRRCELAHIQRRCATRGCRRPIPPRARTCRACGGSVEYRARYRGPDGRERSKVFERKGDAEAFVTSTEGS